MSCRHDQPLGCDYLVPEVHEKTAREHSASAELSELLGAADLLSVVCDDLAESRLGIGVCGVCSSQR